MVELKKNLGQNFLTDKSVAKLFAEHLNIQKSDSIIEIGPGQGFVTDQIAKKSPNKLKIIELDHRLITELKNKYISKPFIEIVNSNFLDWIKENQITNKFKIYGSLPYYITSPIFHSIIYLDNMPEIAVFLIQKEVAYKIAAKAPNNSYLATFIQTFFNTEVITEVPRTSFRPVPNVDGALVKLELQTSIFKNNYTKSKYEKFLHKAYSSPRKMLNKAFSQDELKKFKIDPNARAQNITTKQWLDAYSATLD